MVGPQWPGLTLAWDELGQVPRRQAFKEAHPGATFEQIGSQFVGSVPYTDQDMELSITMRGDSYRAVLDALDVYFSGDPPGSPLEEYFAENPDG